MKKVTNHDGQSADIVTENIEKLKELFPDAFTEGGVNFDVLRQLLGDASVLDEGEEKYGLNWHGKKKARQIALTPSTGTLLPCPEESVDWDTTQNLFIEGDNLEVLKLLQKSYAGKVRFIYIDPPYNTDKDFIYPDRFSEGLETYLGYTGQKDEAGSWNVSDSGRDKSGRKHTLWLNMMYPRIRLARNLLSENGAIFISINEIELANLIELGDDLFGRENLLCLFSWRTDGNFDNQAKFKYCHEYVVAYGKREAKFPHPKLVDPSVDKSSKIYRPEIRNTIVKNGPKNPPSWITLPAGFPASDENFAILARSDSWPHYAEEALIDQGVLAKPTKVYSGWSSKDILLSFIQNDCKPITDGKGQETRFEITRTGAIEVVKLRGEPSHVVSSLSNLGGPQKAASEIEKTGAVFDDYPKPLALVEYLAQMVEGNDGICLDFFAGSGTLAHAVMQLNATDGGKRKWISVQLPEPTTKLDDKGKLKETQAAKAGFQTIAEVARKRIEGAGAEIAKSYPKSEFDSGFKAFQLNQSNIRAWNPDRTDLEETLLSHKEHLVEGRSEQDVLYELLLKRGIELTVPIEERQAAGKTIYSIGYGVLFACLDTSISSGEVDEVAQGILDWHKELEPETDTHVFFRDSAFADDVAKTNMAAILEQNGISHVRSL